MSVIQKFNHADKYRRDNPGIMVRHNYLAAAEMDTEGNYNMIDGVINNVPKVSILEHIRQFKPAPSERGDKPDRSSIENRKIAVYSR